MDNGQIAQAATGSIGRPKLSRNTANSLFDNMVLLNLQLPQLIIGFENIKFRDLLFIKEDENVVLALNGH